eukprot:gene1532-32909_t
MRLRIPYHGHTSSYGDVLGRGKAPTGSALVGSWLVFSPNLDQMDLATDTVYPCAENRQSHSSPMSLAGTTANEISCLACQRGRTAVARTRPNPPPLPPSNLDSLAGHQDTVPITANNGIHKTYAPRSWAASPALGFAFRDECLSTGDGNYIRGATEDTRTTMQTCVNSRVNACGPLRSRISASRRPAVLPRAISDSDRQYMRQALELAKQGLGQTYPNPAVGCVVVKDGQVVGEGYHPKAGMPHAEVYALQAAGNAAKGATAFVTLEPCNHYGRTPPCSKALVDAGVARVVVGVVDPNPLVDSEGIKTLEKAGIEVALMDGAENEECYSINQEFMERMKAGTP